MKNSDKQHYSHFVDGAWTKMESLTRLSVLCLWMKDLPSLVSNANPLNYIVEKELHYSNFENILIN